ncbi:MAG: UDP-N-acetylmuramoyl-tripeptide--D-alanyl-D-alanine ligase [Opitutales bacterium]
MKYFCPNVLQQWTGGYWTRFPNQPITNFCFDTRQLKPNECFLALRSEHNDGHDYVDMAEACGAVAALVDHPIETCSLPQLVVTNTLKAFQDIAKNYRNILKTCIVGITGSCGKTTAKELLALLLGPETFKTPGNYNNHLGLPFSITQIDEEKHPFAVLEVGISEPGEMEGLSELLQPDFAVVLNVNPVHLENFKMLEAIVCEKLKLLQKAKKHVFYPCEWRSYVQHPNGFAFSFNQESGLDTIALELKMIPEGWQIKVDGCPFHLPFLIGEKSAQTFAQVLAVALNLGVPKHQLQESLLLWQPYAQRGVWVKQSERKIFVDCYNANPAAFSDSLQHFYRELDTCNLPNTAVCYCIGSMLELGEGSVAFHRDLAKHFRIGQNDHFILIGVYKEALQDGFKAVGVPTSHIHLADAIAEIQELFNKLPCNFAYLKGSHRYHLENLIAN